MSQGSLIALNNLEITRFFLAIILLLAFAHAFGFLFHKFKMPRVIGEIFGGLVLGPTVFGFIFPEAYIWTFNAFESEGKLISSIYWIGLVLLMFVSGFEMQKSVTKVDKKIILAVIIGATVIPIIAGWLASNFYDFSSLLGEKNNMPALKIIIAIAGAVTSIPVISKIFIDLGVIGGRFAKIVLASATIHDVILWIALAIATGLVSAAAISVKSIVATVSITLVFFLIALFLMPRLLNFSNHLRMNLLIKSSATGYALFICFFFSVLASILNVNIVFGALLAGIILGTNSDKRFEPVKVYIKEIALGFFIPIYFAIVGLKLDLIHYFDTKLFLGFLLFTSIFAILGTVIFAKLVKLDWFSSLNLGIAMNTRGGPGIVLATIAFDVGIINEVFFTALVMIAIITSLFAGYWFKIMLSRGQPLLKEG